MVWPGDIRLLKSPEHRDGFHSALDKNENDFANAVGFSTNRVFFDW